MSKLLVVFGVTGNQGGSVIKAVLEHPILSQQFKIRGITRDPSKPAAQALTDKGVEVIKADMLDKDSLRQALSGAHSVFAVTNYWEKASREVEVTQGKNIADIAKEVGVKHLIWSSLPNVTKVTDGKLVNVPHFDGKAEVEEHIKLFNEDGTHTVTMPFPGNTPIPLFEVASDTGKFVAAILSKYDSKPIGKRILGTTDYYTVDDMLRTFSEVTGQTANFTQVPEEVFKGFFPEFMGQEMLENFILIRDLAYYVPDGREELKESLKILEEKPTSFKEYVENNGPWGKK